MAQDYAFSEAVALAKANLESCEEWVEAEEVIDFIKELHSFLQQPEAPAKPKKKDEGKEKKEDKKEKSKKDEDDD